MHWYSGIQKVANNNCYDIIIQIVLRYHIDGWSDKGNFSLEDITITLTRYKEPNWLIHETLDSLSRQKNVSAEVLFLDQFYNKETEDYCRSLTNEHVAFTYVTIPAKSLSFARNHAIKVCKTNLLLFIDSDAIADEAWAEQLATTLLGENIAVAGGKIVPKWHKTPLLITKSSVVMEQYSLLDQGKDAIETNKVVGANFGLSLQRLGDIAYFDEKLGRREGVLLGGEETDLCDRARASGLQVYYNGKAVVQHQILPERVSYKWIFNRIYYAGMSRALRGGVPNPTHSSRSLWNSIILPIIIIPYAAGYLRAKLSH